MKIYLIGYILIPFSLLFFFVKPRYLLYLLVFFVPFTGTSVLSFSLSGIGSQGIRASFFLGALFILRYFLSALNKEKIKIPIGQRYSLFYLLCFTLIVILSLIMPLLINGKFMVLDSYTDGLVMYAKEKPLYPRLQFVTQAAYLVFGGILTFCIATYSNSYDKIIQLLKIYLISSFVASLWGWLEFFSFYLHYPYPYTLFNQSSANYGGPMIIDGRPRMTSVALEPSVLSQQLLTTIPLLFWARFYNQPFFSRRKDLLMLISIVCVLMLSLSSTAYVGIASLIAIIGFKFLKSKKITSTALLILFALIIAGAVAFPFVVIEIIHKLSLYSGIERFKSIRYGWWYFTQYPILGIGWASFPVWDVVICILAGTGILGFTTFILIIANVYKKLIYIKNSILSALTPTEYHTALIFGIIQSIIILLIASEISGLLYHSQYFWFVLAMTIACSSLKLEDVKIK